MEEITIYSESERFNKIGRINIHSSPCTQIDLLFSNKVE